MMDLNRIALFVRVAETGGFTAAAAALGLPKSAVSRGVARLEEELGVRLLQRTTRKLSLTEAGRLYFEQARMALANLEEATSAVADTGTELRGTIRVTAPVDAGVMLLADLIARFVQEHPGIHVQLTLTSRVVDLVQEGFDLAVRAGTLKDSTLVARRIGVTEMGVFASPAYLRRRGRPQALADLAGHECVLFRGRAGRGIWRLTGPQGEEEVEVYGTIDADDLSFVRRAVAAGAGLGLMPLFLTAEGVQRKKLVRVLPDYAWRDGALHLVTPSARHQPARVRLLRDFLMANLQGLL